LNLWLMGSYQKSSFGRRQEQKPFEAYCCMLDLVTQDLLPKLFFW
jgi:hypothetical protein